MIGWQVPFRAARKLEQRQNWPAAARIYRAILRNGEGENPRVNFQLGNALFRANDLGEAERFLSRAVELKPGTAAWHYRLGFVLERQARPELAIRHYQSALEVQPENPSWHYRLYRCHTAVGNRQDAYDHLAKALNGDQENPKYHDLVAAELRSRGPRWQEAQALERGQPYHEADPSWHLRMAESYASLSRHRQSAESYRRANALKPAVAENLFKEAEQWERAGRTSEASAAFSAGVALKPDGEESRFGPGAYYQLKGNWDMASKAYDLRKRARLLDAELHYRAGLAHDRCFRWKEAAASYLSAVSLEPSQPYWHYKLGFAHERMQAWPEAVDAYEYAASLRPSNRYWWYRAGYAGVKAGDLERACLSFLRAAPADFQPVEPGTQPVSPKGGYLSQLASQRLVLRDIAKDPDLQCTIADGFAAAGDWASAAEGYEKAIYCSNRHEPRFYFLWGHALMQTGNLCGAADAFLQTRIFMTPDGIDVPKYLKNTAQKHSMQYLEYYETVALRPKTILWESNHGATVGCHPLALFRHLADLPEFSGYRHVWAVNDPAVVPDDVRDRGNVFFAVPHSDLYLRVLATASHLVNNVSFPPYFMRRVGQRYLNTWHGTPLKTLGRDMRGPAMEHSNLARNFLHSSHIMSPNAHTSWALIERHDLEGLFRGKIRVTGSPRLDRMVTGGGPLRNHIRKTLNVPEDLPVVLYAPTWRGSTTDRVLDRDALLADLEALASTRHQLVFRAHRLTEKLLAGLDLGVTIVPPEIDTSDLLSAVDVLVTDYSSVAFDFLPTKRPIVYYAYDYEQYSAERGLYLDLGEMPGEVCLTREELGPLVSDALSGGHTAFQDQYAAGAEQFAPYEDGGACARVTDFFFHDSDSDSDSDSGTGIGIEPAAEPPAALFHHSLIPNGISSSFRNLAGSLSGEIRKVLVVEPHVLNKDPGRLSQFQLLPEDVQLVGRVGIHAFRPEERWLHDRFNRSHRLDSPEQQKIHSAAMKREFYRIFGSSVFQSLVEFDGYSPFWTALLAAGGRETKRTIYLHNDMLNEWKMKFANLEAVFRLYPEFDRLLSVSESLGHENARNVGSAFNIDRDLFGYCNNQIDAEAVMQRSGASLDPDLAEWFAAGEQNVLAIGRLSPEKDHAKLISAFIRYRENNPDANLTIIGDGPLRADLEQQIHNSGAGEYILLAGQRENPYPALALASALVLSSLHEGQPMVLFEAMILQRPIICTNLPGPRDILQDRYGLIVENSEDGIHGGLMRLADGNLPRETFDPAAYAKEAGYQFLTAVL
ncbi:CDP-glycerol glycerophosphotransferase family protein [Arthrobacter sp. Edens01]|uniref:CDP-glycerol glycerophosphotransferase family protein n=1 Tax=Arthrobacter sp. Edens01 TaxID=1732020 RepID=UPI0006D95C6C|nr:CDP-glycerol glycerophosphotransferase family protein [Arthrobacter sp. Edens01]KPN18320.1 hypothetical protein AO716_10715 [Arthrobacter sp. Edens01]